jgi:kynurenine formamidase
MGDDSLRMVPSNRPALNLTRRDVEAMAERVKNWGRWGPHDQIGTLNHIGPDEIRRAAALVRKGLAISLGLEFNFKGPQTTGWGNRFNPIHSMLQTGTDAVAGNQDWNMLRYADDMVTMPLQSGTQWDALSHIFYGDKMWNGYDATLVDAAGARKNGIEHTRSRMVGRGVLLDIARFKGGDYLEDGYGIGSSELDACAASQGVTIRRGDFVIVRTGQLEQRIASGDWGTYAAGTAPGLRLETAEWIHRNHVAAVCTDTWGCEVRPNETADTNQPWHWVVIPMIGMTMGEIFYLKDLAEDCAADGVYEFFFCAPCLPITGAVGSPINPIAVK